jgi:hypothetical protein
MAANERGPNENADPEGGREVANITVAFGALLILLGVGSFVLTGATKEQITALIPAGFGLLLGLFGLLARRDGLRKHVMHAAVLLALVGTIVPLVRAAPKVTTLIETGKVEVEKEDGTKKDMKVAVIAQLVMAGLCAAFTGLCVKSFIDARKARKASVSAPPPVAPGT